MDVRDLDRVNLGIIFAAAGDNGKLFVSMIFGAIVAEHGLDLQIHREGPSYVVVMIETAGDAVIAEDRLAIEWARLDDDARFGILNMYLAGVLAGHQRWLDRIAPRLAALGVTSLPGTRAND